MMRKRKDILLETCECDFKDKKKKKRGKNKYSKIFVVINSLINDDCIQTKNPNVWYNLARSSAEAKGLKSLSGDDKQRYDSAGY